MNAAQYRSFQRRFASFMESEGLENLSADPHGDDCPRYNPAGCSCSVELLEGENGPHELDCAAAEPADECNCEPEAFFSWRPCDCCGAHLGGDRYRASGYNRKENRVQVYEEVCTDCIYYAEYGQLDDITMMELEEEEA